MRRKQFLWLLGFISGLAAIGLYLRRWNQQFVKRQVQTQAVITDNGQLRLGKQVAVTSMLGCQAEDVWQLTLTSGLFEHLSWPFLTIAPLDQERIPAVLKEGEVYQVILLLFGLLSLGRFTVKIIKIDQDQFCLRAQAGGQLMPQCHIVITLEKVNEVYTVFSEEIDLYAGSSTEWLSGVVSWLLRYQQARLKKLAALQGRTQ